MDSTLKFIAKIITGEWGWLIWCGAIVLWCAWSWKSFANRMNPRIKQLHEAIEYIRKQPGHDGFAAAYYDFVEWAGKHPLLGHSWNEFSETLVLPTPTDPAPRICNTDDACCHFNETTILNGKLHLQYYKALPNYFTGLGILGTFVGLVCGIYLASKGLASDDPIRLKHALQELLGGAALAFMTSIAGLVASIVFSVYEKAKIQTFHQAIVDWNTELDKRIVRLTPESLASQQLEQLGKQTEHLETFVTKVAFDIAEGLDSRMTKSLVPALDQLVQAVEAMRSERSDSTEKMLRDVVASFAEAMRGSAGREMEAMSGTLAGLKETLVPLLDGMRAAQIEMQQAAGRMVEQVGESYEKCGREFATGVTQAAEELGGTVREAGRLLREDLAAAFGEAANRMQASVQAMEGTLDKVRDSGQASAEAAEKTRELLGEMNVVLARMQHFQHEASAAVEAIRQSSVSLSASNGALTQAASRTQTAAEALRQASEQISGAQQQLQRQWGEYAERFEAVDDSLERAFGRLNEGFKGFAEATSTYMTSLDGHAEKVTGRLASVVNELDAAIADLAETLASSRRGS